MALKVTKDPTTGATELQTPEYMPVGPVRSDPKSVLDRIATLEAQVASLQSAVPRGIELRGWTCSCGVFNGSEKELLAVCRGCGNGSTT